ncbi:MAG: aspartate 1-decarboxylase [Cyanobacteria bacterium]|nr:aspartate 1-decarboxylase [Cyanobacteriota bacterium]
MLISLLKSKIHRATVTDARVDYVGSITIDKALMKEAGIFPNEKVLVASINTGSRLETYVIEGKKNSGEICLNGAAAKVIGKGEKVIIMSFCLMDIEEVKDFKPKIVHVDENNNIIKDILTSDNNEEC